MNRARVPAEARFWAKVDRSGSCWVWLGSTDRKGYGRFNAGSERYVLAHRYAFETTYGATSLCVLHRCDTPACVRPDHLFAGTVAENNRDMCSKGRQQQGETHYSARLSADLVTRIRSEYRAGKIGYLRLARRYGVSVGAIRGVISGKNWKGQGIAI